MWKHFVFRNQLWARDFPHCARLYYKSKYAYIIGRIYYIYWPVSSHDISFILLFCNEFIEQRIAFYFLDVWSLNFKWAGRWIKLFCIFRQFLLLFFLLFLIIFSHWNVLYMPFHKLSFNLYLMQSINRLIDFYVLKILWFVSTYLYLYIHLYSAFYMAFS